MAAACSSKTYPCPFCDKVCNSSSALSKHKKHHHPDEDKVYLVPTTAGKGKLQCGLCELYFGTRLHLCKHLEEVHETPAQIIQRTFRDQEEFDEWAKHEAEQGLFEWNKSWTKKLADGQWAYQGLHCHRSGTHTWLQQLREQRRQWEEARAEQQRQREAAESREREEREARERHERLQELREQRRQHEERRNAHCSNMKFMMMLIVAIVGVITIAINNAYYDSVE